MPERDTYDPPSRIDVDGIWIDKLDEPDNIVLIPLAQHDDSSPSGRLGRMAKDPLKLVSRPLSALARGLFTQRVPQLRREDKPEGKKRAGRDQIIVRGYDKFFNRESLAVYATSLYYVLTLKRNGHLYVCIVAHRNRRNIDTPSGALEKSLDRPSVMRKRRGVAG
ncbi:hypothetical protein FRC09_018387 [Ceratobasidium sp. 395]|nr:hypothetical protein FRC09_018387 [Ceratobasidium sp. 395]